jgi:hypothetical protein
MFISQYLSISKVLTTDSGFGKSALSYPVAYIAAHIYVKEYPLKKLKFSFEGLSNIY